MSWTSSLATRSATLWSLVAAAAAASSSWVAHKDAEKRYLDTLRQRVEQEASNIQIKTQTSIAALRDDARFCAQSPLLREFLLHRGTEREPQWRRLLEEEFRAVFGGKPAYFQMRLLAIDGEEDGQELVRLDRRNGDIAVTPLDKLQSKAGRTYFQEARLLPGNRVYVSEINLNRDFGVVSVPHIPTLRAAAKVNVDGRGEALLIINTNLESLFRDIRQLTSPGSEVRLISSRGDYLMHPLAAATFATDLRTSHFAQREFEEIALEERWTEPGRWLREVNDRELAWAIKVPLEGWPQRVLTAVVSLPGHVWLPGLQASRKRTYAVTLVAALLGGGAAFLIALPMVRRLHLLSTAMRQFDATGSPDALPDAGRDEIGIAVSRFKEMASKVRQQIERLHEARKEAEAANAAKEQFLAVMSHEIRTPMNAVIGLIRALESNDPPPQQRPILNTLKSSADSLMALVNTALDYTCLKEGDIHFLDEDFDIAELVRETVRAHAPAALSKGLKLEVHGIDQPLRMRGDPVRARQVLTNLLHNAIKFTSRGCVAVRLTRDEHFIDLEVSDSGPGIREDERELIFQAFGQTDAARRSGGAGLGLAVSRALLEQQGGALELVSEEGKGATFTARLPFREARSSRASTAGETAGPFLGENLAGLRLLYVEDVASNQQVMECTLEGSGMHLTCVSTAAEACERIAREEFDVILIDLQLPDMPGDVLAKDILARAKEPPPPILAVTAQASEDAAERCRKAGVSSVILKPFSKENLLREIADHAGRRLTNLEALTAIHPTDPERRHRLTATLAEELHAASGEARRMQSMPHEERQRLLRSLYHRLKTMIATLELHTVGAAFEESLSAEDTDSEAAMANLANTLRLAATEISPVVCSKGEDIGSSSAEGEIGR